MTAFLSVALLVWREGKPHEVRTITICKIDPGLSTGRHCFRLISSGRSHVQYCPIAARKKSRGEHTKDPAAKGQAEG